MPDIAEKVILNPHELAADIERSILSGGYDEDGYPHKSTSWEYHRDEWAVILRALRAQPAR